MKKFFTITTLCLILTAVTLHAQWQHCKGGPFGVRINSFAAIGNNLFASTVEGVFRTADVGKTWENLLLPSEYQGTHYITSFRSNLYALASEGLYASTDLGDSWKYIGPTTTDIESITVAADDSAIFLNVYGSVMKSTDFGKTWENDRIIDSELLNISITALMIDGNNVWAGATAKGVYLSTDRGKTWKKRKSGLKEYSGITSFLKDGNTIYAAGFSGVFKTTDYGLTWVEKNSGITDFDHYQIAKKGDDLFLTSWGGGVYRSTDEGESWFKTNSGLLDLQLYSITVFNGNIYVGARSGVYVSSDNGDSWSPANNGLYQLVPEFIETNKNDLVAGTHNGIFISTDNGDSWTPRPINILSGLVGTLYTWIYSLSVSGQDIYALTADGATLFVSSDYGENWTKCYANGYPKFTNNSKYVFISTSIGVLRSDNMGESWTTIENGLVFNGNSKYMDFFESKNDTLIMGNYYNLYHSFDNGNSWDEIGLNYPQSSKLELSSNGNKLVICTREMGIFFSSDRGDTWTQKNNGLQNLYIRTVKLIGNDAIAADTAGNIYYSPDFGDNWFLKNIGLPPQCHVYKLNYNDTYAFAGTDSGMYRARLTDILDVKEDAPAQTTSIYPNPATDFINASDYVSYNYQIVDLLGNVQQRGKVESGKINVSGLVPGFYGIVFTKGGVGKAEKFIKGE